MTEQNDAPMTPEAAAELLRTGGEPVEPVAVLPDAERPEDPGPAEDEEPEEKKRPERRFKWHDDSHLTVEDWLAGNAHAVLEIAPGLTVQFSEAKESHRDEVDALINGIGPAFIMRGLRDGVMATQVRRANNIGLVCQSMTHMNGEPWMREAKLKDRWTSIKGRGQLFIDKLIEALYEFSDQLLWVIDNGDLGNS